MSVKKLLLIIFVLIIGLSLVTYWQFLSFKKSLTKISPFEIKALEPKPEPSPQETKEYKEFISPAGDLKIKYLSSWQEIEPSEFNFETLNTEKAKTLFYGIKTEAEKMKMAWLIVQKLDLGEERDLKKLIEEIKSSGEKGQTVVEAQNLNIEKNSAEFEIIQSQSGYSLKGKEKIILTKENNYSIIIFSLASDWDFFQEEAEEILNSIQVLPNL